MLIRVSCMQHTNIIILTTSKLKYSGVREKGAALKSSKWNVHVQLTDFPTGTSSTSQFRMPNGFLNPELLIGQP